MRCRLESTFRHEDNHMGKGDIRSKRGKISRGTFGARRRKKRKAASPATPKD